MASNLVAQLQRLSLPQTKVLAESKKRASILYDGEKAATIDREAIYDLGNSGLNELIKENQVFKQFEKTLFEKTTTEFERSVETKEVNETLNKNIKKFLLQLSPHFLLRAAHNCLEWLIRRYRINEYNIDDMMALILPYHEAIMFVKCVQTMKITDRSRWNWIKGIQKPGVRLAKQTIISRAASDKSFLKFICETTIAAVNELNERAYRLQALFAFYATITVGALDILDEISDSDVTNIAEALLKGLSSNVHDFCAGSMMITGILLDKYEREEKQLEKRLLQLIIDKLTNICSSNLKREALILLIIIQKSQEDCTKMITEAFFAKMLDDSTITTITESYDKNINVLSLCLPLMAECLANVQKKKNTKRNQKFVDTLLAELNLNNTDAEAVIR